MEGAGPVDRCALFVDAGYVLADGAMAVHGTRRRDTVSWDHARLLELLTGLATERAQLPLLRCYWYETTPEGRRAPEHDALADLPGLKLRLGRIRPGRRGDVDLMAYRDLTTLAREHAICDAFVVSGDEDMVHAVCDAQDHGIRVLGVHIAVDGNWTISRLLRQECDDLVEIAAAQLRPYVTLVHGVDTSSPPPSNGQTPSEPRSGHPQTPVTGQRPWSHLARYAGPRSLPSGTNHHGQRGADEQRGEHGQPVEQGRRGRHGQPEESDRQADEGDRQAEQGPREGEHGHQGLRDHQGQHDHYERPGQDHHGRRHSRPDLMPGHPSGPGYVAQHRSDSTPERPPERPSESPEEEPPSQAQPEGQRSGEQRSREQRSGSHRRAAPRQEPPAAHGQQSQHDSGPPSEPPQQDSAHPYGPAQDPDVSYAPPQPQHPQSSQQAQQSQPPQESQAPQESQQSSGTPTLSNAVRAANKEGWDFGGSVARDAPALWLEAVLARKPRMPSDLEARLLQGSALPIDFLLQDDVRHALRRGFWEALEQSRRG